MLKSSKSQVDCSKAPRQHQQQSLHKGKNKFDHEMKKINLLCPSLKKLPGGILYEQKRNINDALEELKSISLKRVGAAPSNPNHSLLDPQNPVTSIKNAPKNTLKSQPSVQKLAEQVYIGGVKKDEDSLNTNQTKILAQNTSQNVGIHHEQSCQQKQTLMATLISNNLQLSNSGIGTNIENQNQTLNQKEESTINVIPSDNYSIFNNDITNFKIKDDVSKQSSNAFKQISSASNTLHQQQFIIQGNNPQNKFKNGTQVTFDTSQKFSQGGGPSSINAILEMKSNVAVQKTTARDGQVNKGQHLTQGNQKVITEIHHNLEGQRQQVMEKEYNDEILRMTHNLLDMHAPRGSLETYGGPSENDEGQQQLKHQSTAQNGTLGGTGGPIPVAPGSRISHLTVKTFKKMNDTEKSINNQMAQSMELQRHNLTNGDKDEIELIIKSKEKRNNEKIQKKSNLNQLKQLNHQNKLKKGHKLLVQNMKPQNSLQNLKIQTPSPHNNLPAQSYGALKEGHHDHKQQLFPPGISLKKINGRSRSPRRKAKAQSGVPSAAPSTRDEESRRKKQADWKIQFGVATGSRDMDYIGLGATNSSANQVLNKRDIAQFLQTHGFQSSKHYQQFFQQVHKNKKRGNNQKQEGLLSLDQGFEYLKNTNLQNIQVKINEKNLVNNGAVDNVGQMPPLDTDSNQSLNLKGQDSVFFSQSKLKYFEKTQRTMKHKKIMSGLLSPVRTRRAMISTNNNSVSQPFIDQPYSSSPFRPNISGVDTAKGAPFSLRLNKQLPKNDIFNNRSCILKEMYDAPLKEPPLKQQLNEIITTKKSNILSEFLGEASIKSTDEDPTASMHGSIYKQRLHNSSLKIKSGIKETNLNNDIKNNGTVLIDSQETDGKEKSGSLAKTSQRTMTRLPQIDKPYFFLDQGMDYKPPHQLTKIHNQNKNVYKMKLRKKQSPQRKIMGTGEAMHGASLSKIPSKQSPFSMNPSPSPISNLVSPELVMLTQPGPIVTAEPLKIGQLYKGNQVYSTTPLEKGAGISSHTASNYNKHSHFQSDISLIPPGLKKSEIDGVLDQGVNWMATNNQNLSDVRRSLLPTQPNNTLPRLNLPDEGTLGRGQIARQQSPNINRASHNITNIVSHETDTADEELSAELTRFQRHDSNNQTQEFAGTTQQQKEEYSKVHQAVYDGQLTQTSKFESEFQIGNPLLTKQMPPIKKKVIQIEKGSYGTIHGIFPLRSSFQDTTLKNPSPKMESEQQYKGYHNKINQSNQQQPNEYSNTNSNKISRLKTHIIGTENIMSELEKQYERESMKTNKGPAVFMNSTFQPQQQSIFINNSMAHNSPKQRPSQKPSCIDQIIQPVAEAAAPAKNSCLEASTNSYYDSQEVSNLVKLQPVKDGATVIAPSPEPFQQPQNPKNQIERHKDEQFQNQTGNFLEVNVFAGGQGAGVASMPDLQKAQKMNSSVHKKDSIESDPSVSGAVLFGKDGKVNELKGHGGDDEAQPGNVINRHARVLQILNKNLVIHLVDDTTQMNRNYNNEYLNIYNLQNSQ